MAQAPRARVEVAVVVLIVQDLVSGMSQNPMLWWTETWTPQKGLEMKLSSNRSRMMQPASRHIKPILRMYPVHLHCPKHRRLEDLKSSAPSPTQDTSPSQVRVLLFVEPRPSRILLCCPSLPQELMPSLALASPQTHPSFMAVCLHLHHHRILGLASQLSLQHRVRHPGEFTMSSMRLRTQVMVTLPQHMPRLCEERRSDARKKDYTRVRLLQVRRVPHHPLARCRRYLYQELLSTVKQVSAAPPRGVRADGELPLTVVCMT